ncbi:LOW QUALITY PROTEIN: N-methyltransferase [Pseudozyma hubeiensis]|nr:LOW QUALITY PROTEIN: N-methyltransferase [Pseudozyma hubeiensis]
MAGASVAGGSAAQHIDVDDVEHGVGSGISTIATEVVDDDMAEDATSAAQAAQTPLSANTAQAQDESDMAASFYQSTSSSSRKSQSVSKPANSHPIVVNDQDEDDLMEADLPGREERRLATYFDEPYRGSQAGPEMHSFPFLRMHRSTRFTA